MDIPADWEMMASRTYGDEPDYEDLLVQYGLDDEPERFNCTIEQDATMAGPAAAVEERSAPAGSEPSAPAALSGKPPARRVSISFLAVPAENKDGKPVPTDPRNFVHYLRLHPDMEGVFCRNDFSGEIMLLHCPPWEKAATWKPRPVKDEDYTEASMWLAGEGMRVSPGGVVDYVAATARYNTYHPVKDYFADLPKWDGVERVNVLLSKYAGAADNRLNRAIGRKWLCAAMARIYAPGTKFDSVLVMQGDQGLGKSQFGEALLPDETWVTDSVKVGDDAREIIQNTRGCMLVELSELAGKSKRDILEVRQFVTRRSDKARAAFGRTVQDVARQFVMYASVNGTGYLSDDQGNRRWWPVIVWDISLPAVRADRDQIWAEVLTIYKQETLYIDDPELKADLEGMHSEAMNYGPWFELLSNKIPAEGDMMISVSDAWAIAGLENISKLTAAQNSNLKAALAGLGFDTRENAKASRKDGKLTKRYVRGDANRAVWWSFSTQPPF